MRLLPPSPPRRPRRPRRRARGRPRVVVDAPDFQPLPIAVAPFVAEGDARAAAREGRGGARRPRPHRPLRGPRSQGLPRRSRRGAGGRRPSSSRAGPTSAPRGWSGPGPEGTPTGLADLRLYEVRAGREILASTLRAPADARGPSATGSPTRWCGTTPASRASSRPARRHPQDAGRARAGGLRRRRAERPRAAEREVAPAHAGVAPRREGAAGHQLPERQPRALGSTGSPTGASAGRPGHAPWAASSRPTAAASPSPPSTAAQPTCG